MWVGRSQVGGRRGAMHGRVWPYFSSLALAAVSSVENVFAWGLVHDVLKSDAVTAAAHVAHYIPIATSTRRLQLCDEVVQVHLLAGDFRTPSSKAVIRPQLLVGIFKPAVLMATAHEETLLPGSPVESIEHVVGFLWCTPRALSMCHQIRIPVPVCGTPSVEVEPAASPFHLMTAEHEKYGWETDRRRVDART